jgi:hypothetical protein
MLDFGICGNSAPFGCIRINRLSYKKCIGVGIAENYIFYRRVLCAMLGQVK